MKVYEKIEVQDPSAPESMMSLTLTTKVGIEEINTITDRLEATDLKRVDEHLDLNLMENTDEDISDTIDKTQVLEMMYEEDRLWNMEEIDQWDDEYIIDMTDRQQMDEPRDEAEEEAIMLTNQECENLKKFLVQEAAEKPRVFCRDCSKRECVSCENLQSKYSEEDQEIYKKMWDNVKLVQEGGKTRVRATYLYRNPPH